MSINRPPRIGRFTAQRLLCGEEAGPERLAELLVTAAAPAERDAFAGEEAAVSAFREARLVAAPRPPKRSMIKVAAAELLTIKVAAAALTVTAAGGVALAAGTGHLPGSFGRAAPTARPTATPGIGTHHASEPSPAPDKNPSDSPSLVGLCHAYQADARAALHDPAFTHLITVAGGKDKVAVYCTDLLKTHPGKTHPGKARTARPTDTPAAQPTSTPVTRPTATPRKQPTDPPKTPPTVAHTHPAKATQPVH